MPSQRKGGSCVSPIADDDAYASLALALESTSLSTPEKKEVSPAMPVEEHKSIEDEVRSIALPFHSLYSLVPEFPQPSHPFLGLLSPITVQNSMTDNFNRRKSTQLLSSRLQPRQPSSRLSLLPSPPSILQPSRPSSSLSLLPSLSLHQPRWLPS